MNEIEKEPKRSFAKEEVTNSLRLLIKTLAKGKETSSTPKEEISSPNIDKGDYFMLKTLMLLERRYVNMVTPDSQQQEIQCIQLSLEDSELNNENKLSEFFQGKHILVGFCGDYEVGKTTLINNLFNSKIESHSQDRDMITLVSQKNQSFVVMELLGFNHPFSKDQNKEKAINRLISQCDIIVYVVNSVLVDIDRTIQKLTKKNDSIVHRPIIIHNSLSIVSSDTLAKRIADFQKLRCVSKDFSKEEYVVEFVGNLNIPFMKELSKASFNAIHTKISEVKDKSNQPIKWTLIWKKVEKSCAYVKKKKEEGEIKHNKVDYFSYLSPSYSYSINTKGLTIDLEMIKAKNIASFIEKKKDSVYIIITAEKKLTECHYLFTTQKEGNYFLKIKIPQKECDHIDFDHQEVTITYDKGIAHISYKKKESN